MRKAALRSLSCAPVLLSFPLPGSNTGAGAKNRAPTDIFRLGLCLSPEGARPRLSRLMYFSFCLYVFLSKIPFVFLSKNPLTRLSV